MLEAPTQTPHAVQAETAQRREQLERLRADNDRLRAENRHLRAALDAHVRRVTSTSLFGPLEMTAGTSVGPRRRRRESPRGGRQG